ncbi:MAG: hypothetical protein ACJAV6_000583 [Candidatus Paceibacteria bacterium]|jgi:hypothetical protein
MKNLMRLVCLTLFLVGTSTYAHANSITKPVTKNPATETINQPNFESNIHTRLTNSYAIGKIPKHFKTKYAITNAQLEKGGGVRLLDFKITDDGEYHCDYVVVISGKGKTKKFTRSTFRVTRSQLSTFLPELTEE